MSPAPPTSLKVERDDKVSKRKRDGKGKGPRSETGSHLDGAFGAEVGLEDVLQALRGVDVHVERRGLVEDLRIRIQHPQRHLPRPGREENVGESRGRSRAQCRERERE